MGTGQDLFDVAAGAFDRLIGRYLPAVDPSCPSWRPAGNATSGWTCARAWPTDSSPSAGIARS